MGTSASLSWPRGWQSGVPPEVVDLWPSRSAACSIGDTQHLFWRVGMDLGRCTSCGGAPDAGRSVQGPPGATRRRRASDHPAASVDSARLPTPGQHNKSQRSGENERTSQPPRTRVVPALAPGACVVERRCHPRSPVARRSGPGDRLCRAATGSTGPAPIMQANVCEVYRHVRRGGPRGALA